MTNFNATSGIEETQRSALIRLFDGVNAAITEREAMGRVSDEALANHMGVTYVPLEVELIDNLNFYEGHRPSLIKAPIDKYPNLSIWGVRATPHVESASSDHTNITNVLLFIEVMCKAIEEGDVNKRLVRTVEAVNSVMQEDPTLGGGVTGFTSDPTLNLSDVFVRREQTSYGDLWYWQGARLEYVVRKDSNLPSSSDGTIFRSVPLGMTAADLATLDQI